MLRTFQNSWDPVEWLRNSWEDQDVVVEFFRKGQYTAKQRAQAEGEFVRAASILATSANDDGMKKWAMDLMHDQFECLEALDEFWGSLVIVDKAVDQVIKAALSTIAPRSRLRKRAASGYVVSPSASRRKVEIKEKDGIRVSGLPSSLGTFIKSKAVNLAEPTNEKDAYFKSLGENNMLDISEHSKSSQMDMFTGKQQKQILQMFGCDPQYDELCDAKLMRIIESAGSKSLKAAVKSMHVYISNAKGKEAAIGRAVLSLLERHHYDPDIFDDANFESLSENDLIVKFWGNIIEQAYLGSSIRPHWGDTVPRTFKKHPRTNRPKMDLRLIYYGSREEDVGTGQVGWRVVADKYYHDKKKLALAGKAQLNEYISTYDLDVKQAQNLKVCTIQLLGSRGELSVVELQANGLYTIQKLWEFALITNINNIKEEAMGLIKFLSMLLYLTDHLKNNLIHYTRQNSMANRSMDSMKYPREKHQSSQAVNWIRDIV